MTRLNDLRVEKIDAGDKVYCIYVDDDGTAENPREFDSPSNGVCGTIYSLEGHWRDPDQGHGGGDPQVLGGGGVGSPPFFAGPQPRRPRIGS